MWHEVIEGLKHIGNLAKEIANMGATLDGLKKSVDANTAAVSSLVANQGGSNPPADVITAADAAPLIAQIDANTAAVLGVVTKPPATVSVP